MLGSSSDGRQQCSASAHSKEKLAALEFRFQDEPHDTQLCCQAKLAQVPGLLIIDTPGHAAWCELLSMSGIGPGVGVRRAVRP